jgi:transcriptional regulator with XRE-family HTH domain
MDTQLEIFLKLLEVKNFNQAELAKRTGKPVERINEWNNGKHLPSFEKFVSITEKLGYSLHVKLLKNKK